DLGRPAQARQDELADHGLDEEQQEGANEQRGGKKRKGQGTTSRASATRMRGGVTGAPGTAPQTRTETHGREPGGLGAVGHPSQRKMYEIREQGTGNREQQKDSPSPRVATRGLGLSFCCSLFPVPCPLPGIIQGVGRFGASAPEHERRPPCCISRAIRI